MGATDHNLTTLCAWVAPQVSRWVAEAARQRQVAPEFEKEMKCLDEMLSAWALDAQERGLLDSRRVEE